ncbi:(Fe-S)-binding protein [Arenimonas caeni]|jgi:glycolate oxidase iron-sulfur subunit|uniref:(Fe-S)-binding protein n=1 Tax=Arenimonas caeni TaxID=2058085 RepID=UPI002A35F74C|nr:(Fe-S)-binding protein [Arenimonas caeni]MDY0021994.1 (Fe-S)-binding protein [Arenimonas caeni]
MPDMPPPARPEPARTPGAAGLVALADRCVQCGLCLPHCPTYRLDRNEAESPRGRIAYIRAVAAGQVAPGAAGDTHLDHCLGCRRCEAVCPAGVRYGELLVGARAAQAARRPLSARTRAVLALLARPRLLGLLAGLQRRLGRWLPASWQPVPAPPASAAIAPARPAAPTETLAVFTGCIARSHEAGSRAALARLLAAAGIATTEPAGQGCCGAAAAHAGDADGAQALAASNRAAFSGQARVLCLASGCQDTLARALGGVAAVEDALVALDRVADALAFRPASRRVALHLPCTQRNVVRSDAALRRLLARIPGLDLVDLPDTGCCGAAGLHQLAEPDRAAALRAPLLEALAASGASELLSANIGCRLHLAGGTRIAVRHPIDFLAEHLA